MSNSESNSKSKLKLSSSIFRFIILIALSAPLVYAVYKQWMGVRTTLASIDWEYVAIGTLIQLVALTLMGLISWIVLYKLNARQPLLKVTGIYFISQVAKYLPGGIWAFPGRAIAYQAVGVDKVTSVLSVIREVIVLFLGAATIGLLGLIQGLPIAEWINLTIIFGIVISILLVILTQIPGFWKSLRSIKFVKKINFAVFESENSQLDLRWLGYTFIVSLIYWVITGIGFYFITVAVTPNGESLTWLQASSIFALAWSAGFVIVVAPAGLGVRESALSLLLSLVMPMSEALSVAIIARLWWTVTEAVYIVIALVWLSGKANRFFLTKVKTIKKETTTSEAES